MTPPEIVLVVDPHGHWLGDGTGPDRTTRYPTQSELELRPIARRAPARPDPQRPIWQGSRR